MRSLWWAAGFKTNRPTVHKIIYSLKRTILETCKGTAQSRFLTFNLVHNKIIIPIHTSIVYSISQHIIRAKDACKFACGHWMFECGKYSFIIASSPKLHHLSPWGRRRGRDRFRPINVKCLLLLLVYMSAAAAVLYHGNLCVVSSILGGI